MAQRPARSVWDRDLWGMIYDVHEPKTRAALVALYRLILDMRESDVLAQNVADRVNKDKRIVLSWGVKAFAALMSLAVFVNTILAIRGGWK